MTTTQEAMKLALDALEWGGGFNYAGGMSLSQTGAFQKAIAALRQAISEGEQAEQRSDSERMEPVAVISESAIGLVKLHSNGACLPFGTQLYAAPVEPVKQKPVGEVDLHKELGQLRWMGGDEGWDNAIHAVRKRLEELYAAPVDAKAIRAEALEQAAKVCEQGTGDAVQTDVLKALWKERERIAEVIRGLK